MSSLHRSSSDGASALFRYLENYHRISLDDACRIGIGADDTVDVWAKERGRWRQFTKAEQTLKLNKFQRDKSACRSIITSFFGLNRYQYAKIRDSFEHENVDNWAGIYRANQGYTKGPQFAIVVEIPTYWKELAVGVGLASAGVVGAGFSHAFGSHGQDGVSNKREAVQSKSKCNSKSPTHTAALRTALSIEGPSRQGVTSKSKFSDVDYYREGVLNTMTFRLLDNASDTRHFQTKLTDNREEYYELEQADPIDIDKIRANMKRFLELHEDDDLLAYEFDTLSVEQMDQLRREIVSDLLANKGVSGDMSK